MGHAEIVPDIFLVRLPLPFALSSVNCYLLRDGSGWTVLDTGLHTPAAAAAWASAFAALSIHPRAITRIVLTHFHPDHFGMAGWLQAQSGAPVLMAPREIALASEVWGKPDDAPDPIEPLLLAHGAPEAVVGQIVAAVRSLRVSTRPLPSLTPLRAGSTLTIGARRFRAIHAPGHSDGQLIFHSAADGLLLCGDHVLIKISPHIGCWPESEPNPLGRYLASLAELRALDVRLALPGHGRPIEQWAARLDELVQHHATRLERMRAAVAASSDAYSVAMRVFDFGRFTPHEIRFAVAETVAHLELLVLRGALGRRDDHGRVWYTATA